MKRLTPEEFLFSKESPGHGCLPMDFNTFNSLMQAYADHCEGSAWIGVDCSLPEAMPKDHQSKLVQVVSENVEYMQDVTYYDHRHNCWGNTRWVGKITHWRPLPSPPSKISEK